METISLSAADEARFWSKISKTDDCWNWVGSMFPNRYGCFSIKSEKHLAHRLSYSLHVGIIPHGMVIDHLCHNRGCVNPEHLQAVTNKQNLENFAGPMRNSASGIRGVCWHKGSKKWYTYAAHNGKMHTAGVFVSIEDAAAAVIELRNRLHTNNRADRVGASGSVE